MARIFSERKQYYLARFLLMLFGICWAFNFYQHLSKVDNCFFVDLRNRVVGARLMKQDISPYFFKWSSAFPETLRDPIDGCNTKNSMVTAPPSLLLLMQPLTGISYKQICYLWAVIHYLFFLFIFGSIYFYFRNSYSRNLITISGIILLFCSQWVQSIFVGQSHFILPAVLGTLILLSGSKWGYRFLSIGLLFSFLVWIRPNAILIFPFLLCCKEINRWQVIKGLLAGGLLLAGITLALNHENEWLDFYLSCKEWIKMHIQGIELIQCPHPEIVEGKLVKFQGEYPARLDSEITNLFGIIHHKFNVAVKQNYITVGSLIIYLALLYFSSKRPFGLLPDALLMGMFLYWLFEITAPFNKTSYYFLELFFIIYYLAGKFKELNTASKVFLLLSFLFNFLSFVPINMVIAELCLIGSLCFYLFKEYFQSIRFSKTA